MKVPLRIYCGITKIRGRSIFLDFVSNPYQRINTINELRDLIYIYHSKEWIPIITSQKP